MNCDELQKNSIRSAADRFASTHYVQALRVLLERDGVRFRRDSWPVKQELWAICMLDDFLVGVTRDGLVIDCCLERRDFTATDWRLC
jgi:hypothetical protein